MNNLKIGFIGKTLTKFALTLLLLAQLMQPLFAQVESSEVESSEVESVEVESKPTKNMRLGFVFGFNLAEVAVSDDPNEDFAGGNGFGNVYGLFIEKPLTSVLSATANLELLTAADPGLGDVFSSTSFFASVGGVLGRFNQDKHPYASVSYGVNYIDLDDNGVNPNDCLANCAASERFRSGGSGNGSGYRVAVGAKFFNRVRGEISYLNLSATSSDFPNNSTLEVKGWQILLRMRVN